jgi:hypothetical protein
MSKGQYRIVFVILFLLLMPLTVVSQNVVVSAMMMNNLYRGTDNILLIAVENQPCEKMVVKTSPDSIIKLDNCRYNLRCNDDARKEALIEVGIQMKDSVKWLEKHWLRIRNIPCPVPVVDGKEAGEIKISTLLANPVIELLKTDSLFPVDHQFAITSFSAKILSAKDSVLYDINGIHGNSFSSDLLSYIATSEPGEILEIYDVQITMDGKPQKGYTRSVGPFFITNEINPD